MSTNPGMDTGEMWTEDALHALARDYLAMLQGELRGRDIRRSPGPYTLSHRLSRFSSTSVMQGCRHISWILMELGFPCLRDYRPEPGYPKALVTAIERYLANHPELLALIQVEVDRPVYGIPGLEGRKTGEILVEPPAGDEIPGTRTGGENRPPVAAIDYLEREQQNYSLRVAGEQFVIAYETQRLLEADREILAEGIEHVSAEEGEACGFAIHSYETDGSDRFIQVKTTRFRRETPFYVSANEVKFSTIRGRRFWLYRVYDFRDQPCLYCLDGALEERLLLEPTAYRARTR